MGSVTHRGIGTLSQHRNDNYTDIPTGNNKFAFQSLLPNRGGLETPTSGSDYRGQMLWLSGTPTLPENAAQLVIVDCACMDKSVLLDAHQSAAITDREGD